jgi:histidine triad (HIT) family protein
MDKDCIFCQIVEKKIPSKIVFEEERCLAFLDIFPISNGHTIVIPKEHYQNLEDIPNQELLETYKFVKKVAVLIHNKLKIDGYNILQNNFKSAGQEINHFHIHIIPRRKNDQLFRLKIPKSQATEQDLEKALRMLKS